MIELREATAGQEIPLGHFLDSITGDDEETGLTIANTDIKIWKNGATTLVNKNSGDATHMSNSIYYAVLDAIDSDTPGPMVIFVHVAGALAVRVECSVLLANVWDNKYDTPVNFALEATAQLILDYEAGDWEITNDKMIFKTKAGATLATYNLTKAGVPNSDSPDKRTKI